MNIEHEAKVLDIEPVALEASILGLGGRKLGDRRMRRHVYDVIPGDRSTWIRLRDAGDEVTLTVKKITSDRIDGTHEVEVTVDDFETTDALLGLLGFTAKSYQENRRVSFVLDGAQLEVDTWPGIPPYLEIESDSTEHVLRVASVLGYTELDLTAENTIDVYARHGIDLTEIADLRF